MHKTYNQTHEKRIRNIGVNTQKNITQTIGELLKNERENKNLSLTAISNQLNVPYKKTIKNRTRTWQNPLFCNRTFAKISP